jgi:DNA-damage-inducible protein D
MELLGYSSMASINKAVQKAMTACVAIGAPLEENFKQIRIDGGSYDYNLSRFACYLTVMNGDVRNPRVANAQAYFATLAEAHRRYIEDDECVERVLIRTEVSERERSLNSVASAHDINNYAFFQNAGYRGMYNLSFAQLRVRKHVPEGRSPLDFMGKTELAANLFRITQTEAKIRHENVRGQRRLETAAESVGQEVRATMCRISGAKPEDLPPAEDIRSVRNGLKRAGREFAKIGEKSRVGSTSRRKPCVQGRSDTSK